MYTNKARTLSARARRRVRSFSPRLIELLPPFRSQSDSVLNALIMNRPQGVFAALQQQANGISKSAEGPLTA